MRPILARIKPLHWAGTVTAAVCEQRRTLCCPSAGCWHSEQAGGRQGAARPARQLKQCRTQWAHSTLSLVRQLPDLTVYHNHVPANHPAALHRQSVTAVALSADNQTVYSTSKDGSIFITDVETGTRCACCIGPWCAPGVCARVWKCACLQSTSPDLHLRIRASCLDGSCCSLLREGG